MMAGPPSQVETAKERVALFLSQQKAKARDAMTRIVSSAGLLMDGVLLVGSG